MRATSEGITITKTELAALLKCAAKNSEDELLNAVTFIAGDSDVRASATDSHISCEAVGASVNLTGRWIVNRTFLEACARQAKSKGEVLLSIDGEDLPEAVFYEPVETDDGDPEMRERCRIRPEGSALVAQQALDLDVGPLTITKHETAVPCVSLSAAHLSAVALVAKAAGRDTVALWSQRSAMDAVGFEFCGPTRWVVLAVPVPGDDEDAAPARQEKTSATVSFGETSVTVTADSAKRLDEVGRSMAHGIGNRKARTPRNGGMK